MLDSLKRFFHGASTRVGSDTVAKDTQHDLVVATCALFVEMAKIDESFSDAEMETIIAILKDKYGLSKTNADALIEEAAHELDESVDLWQFARLINENYSIQEKVEIIETLWRIVFVDGRMDKYEDYLMHKLANLLRLTHQQLIGAKLKVRQEQHGQIEK